MLGRLWSLWWFWRVDHLLELLVADASIAVAVGNSEHVSDVLIGHGHRQVVHDEVEVRLSFVSL